MTVETGTLAVNATLAGASLPALELGLRLSPDSEGLFESDVDVDVGEDVSAGVIPAAALDLALSLIDSPLEFIDPTRGFQLVGPLSFSAVNDANARDIVKGSGWYEENERGQQFGWQESFGRMGEQNAADQISGRVPTRSTFGQAGRLSATFGVPYGRTQFQVNAIVVPNLASAAAKRQVVPLVVEGIAENSGDDRSFPDTRDFVGVGPLLKYAQRKVSLQLPRGHGWTRKKIVRTILERIGVSPGRIAVGGNDQLFGEVNVVERDALSTIREVLFPELLELYVDAAGYWRTRSLVPFGKECRLTLTARSIERGSMGEVSTTQGPTRLALRGIKQILRDDDGVVTEDLPTVTIEAPYSPRTATQFQRSSGTLNGGLSTTPPPVTVMVVSRIERSITRRGDTVESERTRTYGWKNPIRWRYTLDSDGTHRPSSYGEGFLYESTATADDSTQLYAWTQERFVQLTDEVTRYVYDEVSGYMTSTIVSIDAWHLPRASFKSRLLPSDAWETLPFHGTSGTWPVVLANHEAVYDGPPYYGIEALSQANAIRSYPADPFNRETRSFVVTEDGFIAQQQDDREEWGHRDGTSYLFAGGESRDSADLLQLAERRVVTYVSQREGWSSVIDTRTDGDGNLIERRTTSMDGHLPAAEKREVAPDPILFPDARPASRYEQQELVVTLTAPVLEQWRERQEDDIEVPYAESIETLQRVGWYYIREGAKSQINVTSIFLPWLHRGDRIMLYSKTQGYSFDGIVRRVRHPAGRIARTELTLDSYYL